MTIATTTDHFQPPSAVLKKLFHNSVGSITDDSVMNAAKLVLLPPTETRFWLEHLQAVVDNRRRGAAKAAATRRARAKKKVDNNKSAKQAHPEAEGRYFCATCGKKYEEEAEEEETWIGCDLCDAWYHINCEKLEAIPECNYICIKCCNS